MALVPQKRSRNRTCIDSSLPRHTPKYLGRLHRVIAVSQPLKRYFVELSLELLAYGFPLIDYQVSMMSSSVSFHWRKRSFFFFLFGGGGVEFGSVCMRVADCILGAVNMSKVCDSIDLLAHSLLSGDQPKPRYHLRRPRKGRSMASLSNGTEGHTISSVVFCP